MLNRIQFRSTREHLVGSPAGCKTGRGYLDYYSAGWVGRGEYCIFRLSPWGPYVQEMEDGIALNVLTLVFIEYLLPHISPFNKTHQSHPHPARYILIKTSSPLDRSLQHALTRIVTIQQTPVPVQQIPALPRSPASPNSDGVMRMPKI